MIYYLTLMTSLPRHGRQFKVKQTPISRMQLVKRLKLLPEPENKYLDQLIDLVWNSWFSLELPLSETMKQAKPLLALNNPFINEIISWFFDIRSLFVALRLRKTHTSPPLSPKDYWHTRWSRRLITNWDQPDFNLIHVYPWIVDVNTKMSNNKTDEVEDILLMQIWNHLNVIEVRHFFDFEALIIYVLRWNIVNYWSQFNEKKARQHIVALSDKIITDSSFKIKDKYHD